MDTEAAAVDTINLKCRTEGRNQLIEELKLLTVDEVAKVVAIPEFKGAVHRFWLESGDAISVTVLVFGYKGPPTSTFTNSRPKTLLRLTQDSQSRARLVDVAVRDWEIETKHQPIDLGHGLTESSYQIEAGHLCFFVGRRRLEKSLERGTQSIKPGPQRSYS